MRLLLTTDTVGGVWTFACELSRALLARGHHVLLVSFGRVPSQSQLAEATVLETYGLSEYVPSDIALEWQPHNEDAYTLGEPLLLRLCQQFRPDALLLSQFCFGALPVSVHKLVIAHSDVLSWADAVGCAPLRDDAWLQTYRMLVQKGLHGAALVIAPTVAMLDSLRTNFVIDAATQVIPNGRSLPLSSAKLQRQVRAVTAGRMWDPAKNLALLRTADLPLPVVIAGEADSESLVMGQLTWTGHLETDALLTLFRESAIYICCSRYEPFGLAALEAALCGCAVLAYDIASLREVWNGGALYFQDAGSLSSLLRTLVADTALLKAAQARSVKRAQRYTSAAMADGYLQAVDSLLPFRTETAHAA